MSVFQLISVYGRLVPMVDLTSFLRTRENLSPTEKKICQDSAKLKGFVMDFMDKCFTLVENSTLELIRQEQSTSDAHMSSEVLSQLSNIQVLTPHISGDLNTLWHRVLPPQRGPHGR